MDYSAIHFAIPYRVDGRIVMARHGGNQALKRVAVCVDKGRRYGRGVLRGIAEHVETHGRWSLMLDPHASGSYGADWLRDWELIRERACDGLTVAEIARTLGISRTAFFTRFKRTLGRLPHQEILRARTERAKSLLRQTTLPVAEVSRRCGFSNPEYLNVVFKRMCGITPGRFRSAPTNH